MSESPILGLMRSACNPNPPADTKCVLTPKDGLLVSAIMSCNSCGVHQVGPSQPGVCDCCARKGISGMSAIMGMDVTLVEEEKTDG